MIKGARKLPSAHLSIRVPWHDSGWGGSFCSNPRGNTSCLVLKRISELRDDGFEESMAGQQWGREGEQLPACAAERGGFMAPFGYTRRVTHPYSSRESRYNHFRRSAFQHTEYAAATVPFAWMMKESNDGIPRKAKELGIEFKPQFEPELKFDSIWVQDRRNQLAMLDTFFSAIVPDESLVFFYAKNTPLSDDSRRIIVGIGRVRKVGLPVEYRYHEPIPRDGIRCVLWERNIHHSIRPEIDDGFLLPYQEILKLAEKNPEIDPSDFVLHAPEECWDSFSMGSEHVTHDQAITVLLSCASLLERLGHLVSGDWGKARSWIDARLNRLWALRGAFPGLGSALTSFGLSRGTLIAHAIGQKLNEDGSNEVRDPWPMVDTVLREPDQLPPELAATIGSDTLHLWESLKPERRDLLKLLARFELTADQAQRWFNVEERTTAGIEVTDHQILENPYTCFEEDRGRTDPISVGVVDRGLFPDSSIASVAPVPSPSHCGEAIDRRRGRALMIDRLETANSEGHTLLPQTWLIQRVRDLDLSPQCAVGSDWVDAFSEFLSERLMIAELSNGDSAWQLTKDAKNRQIISTRVRRRLKGKRHLGDCDWSKLIDGQLPSFAKATDPELEKIAREEKSIALEELFRSRFSVLIGPAGTGKTSLLTALLSMEQVSKEGVLLLAPTGKARVQMQRRATGAKAFTLAQFLLRLGRYDPASGAYKVTDEANREGGYATVIIDECSMLTEDQLAAALDAIETAVVGRLILVGDPRQLPPIGAGRPFADIVSFLCTGQAEGGSQPQRGYAELKTVRRQTENSNNDDQFSTRDDIVLSKWFGGEAPDPGADGVWSRIVDGTANGVRAVEWSTDEDLQEKLLAEIQKTTREISGELDVDLNGLNDNDCFETSLGGRPFKGAVYFGLSQSKQESDGDGDRAGGASDVESWQILSPIRAGEKGVDGLNRWLQQTYRRRAQDWAEPEQYWHRKICKPLGAQRILYGDKVINVVNARRWDVWPKGEAEYLANGEIGIAIGQYKGPKWKPKGLPWKLEVEFSTQLGSKFGFSGKDFGEEGVAPLELAYALTIHKCQGSEFGRTFVVIPNPCRLLSRELIYTALTRQREEVVLFHQGDLHGLWKLSSATYSETNRRLTNLFEKPLPIEYAGAFFESGLIHRTVRGELVRSKSEVIVANILHDLDVTYSYEQPFRGRDGSLRYPDFTIDNAETGRRFFLEHLGMMSEPSYRKSWEAKLEWYRSQGVLPFDEGEGEEGTLVTTTEEKGFDSAEVERHLRDVLDL